MDDTLLKHVRSARRNFAAMASAYSLGVFNDNFFRRSVVVLAILGGAIADAAELAGVDMAIFPDPEGPRVIRMGNSRPRQYWQKYWIQLCLEIADWLGPAAKRAALRRLKDHDVQYE